MGFDRNQKIWWVWESARVANYGDYAYAIITTFFGSFEEMKDWLVSSDKSAALVRSLDDNHPHMALFPNGERMYFPLHSHHELESELVGAIDALEQNPFYRAFYGK